MEPCGGAGGHRRVEATRMGERRRGGPTRRLEEEMTMARISGAGVVRRLEHGSGWEWKEEVGGLLCLSPHRLLSALVRPRTTPGRRFSLSRAESSQEEMLSPCPAHPGGAACPWQQRRLINLCETYGPVGTSRPR